MTAHDKIFTEAFESFGDELFRHAYFRLSDREKAVDCVEDTFVRALTYMQSGGSILDMRSFLYRTMRHLIIDEYRRKKSSSLDALLEDEHASDALLPSDTTNTIEAAEARLDGAQALVKVHELPEPFAEVILLRYVDGLSPSEIAERIDVSPNVVSVRLNRALAKLKELLTPPS